MNQLQSHPKHIKFATTLVPSGTFLSRGMMSGDSAIDRECEPCCGRPGQIGCKLDALYFDFTNSNLAIDPLHEIRISSIEEFRKNGFECQYEMQEDIISCHLMAKPNSLPTYQKSSEAIPAKSVSGILQNLNYSNNNQVETYFALRESKVSLPQCYIDNYDHILESYVTLNEPKVISSSSVNNQNSNPLETYMTFKEQRKKKKPPKVEHCVFCKNNGEDSSLYSSHILKDETGRVSCPVLRSYTCPLCGSNGDNAHTVRYCPLGTSNPSNNVCGSNGHHVQMQGSTLGMENLSSISTIYNTNGLKSLNSDARWKWQRNKFNVDFSISEIDRSNV